jgi:hypothetical protein
VTRKDDTLMEAHPEADGDVQMPAWEDQGTREVARLKPHQLSMDRKGLATKRKSADKTYIEPKF